MNADNQSTQKPFQVLLAYDGSVHARAAAELLADLAYHKPACLQDCRLAVLAVLPTQYITGHEQLEAALNQAAESLRSSGLQVATELKAGNPAACIIAQAEEIKADLIVIGARGLRATLGILLGGVAQQVVEYSHRPVLVVREPYQPIERVLLVTDGSDSSLKAASYLAQHPGEGQPRRFPLPAEAEISLMHVLPPSIPTEVTLRAWSMGPEALYPPPLPAIELAALEEQEKRAGEQLLERTAGLLRKGGLKVKSVLRRGDAASEIITYAKEKKVNLIVCGSRGLSQVAGWLLGSVSRKLLHYAGCSVLVVK
jgi:nucleotide-binding universal stress UspA family protein